MHNSESTTLPGAGAQPREIVFALVEHDLMSKTEDDRIEDFIDVYDFASEFDWNRRRAEFRKQNT